MTAEKNVFAYAQLRNEHEFLMNDIDAEIVSLVRGPDLDGPALPGHLPAVRLISPGDDLHERGFAGAVFTDQCVNFAQTHREGHVVEYGDAAEGLCDVLHPEERFRVLRRQLRCGQLLFSIFHFSFVIALVSSSTLTNEKLLRVMVQLPPLSLCRPA